MSNDIVDDLHAAEQMCGYLAASLEQLVGPGAPFEHSVLPTHSSARAALAAWAGYCRPSCGAEGDPAKSDDCDDECCGCPCGHVRAENPAEQRRAARG